MNIITRIKDIYDYFFSKQKELNRSNLGINCFFDQPIFKSNNLVMQGIDIRDNLRIDIVRIMFDWNDSVQSTSTSQIDWSAYDDIIRSLPVGLKALIIIAGEPSWLEKEPKKRKSFRSHCHNVIDRYKNEPKILGWQIGNEVDASSSHENEDYSFVSKPAFYMEVMYDVASYSKRVAPNKLVVGAATSSIIQNFPDTLKYNQKMKEFGEERLVDVWAIHYCGESPWSLLRPGGVLDFLQSIKKPIWITKMSCDNQQNHIQYFEKHVNFLELKVPNIQKFFIYQYNAITLDTDMSSLYTYILGLK